MKKWIIIALLIAPFVYANHKKPAIVKHQQKIYQMAMGQEAVIDEAVYAMPQWEGLEFVDWTFLTATRDKEKLSLVSIGILDYINVMDKEWGTGVFDAKSKDSSGGTR